MPRRKKRNSGFGVFLFLLFFSAVLVLYLLGSVEINLAILENDNLLKEKEDYVLKVNDLRMQINRMRSYQNISTLAKAQGLISVPAVMIDELTVDLNEPGKKSIHKSLQKMQYAGMRLSLNEQR